ncbi:GAF domain-containing protein [Alteromonas oceanisediminis]|uniref:GAF domain-containing protein n=1 Tax=Alteromonas oceanisediminis TaxID=2836180 RepID=UPI001BDA4B29|nr:GAF domain-containing protein [Alteromonas oceanisediminis]MBT0587127.1 GAF domain-containing protein [Alteromonas oceanisediminis]
MRTDYTTLLAQAKALIADETDAIANMANLSALLYHNMHDVNWAGFYRFTGEELLLGPFHGQPACIRIAMGKGVCGTAATQRETQLVKDVHAFAGHIACDAASNAEIVVPIVKRGKLFGVLDIDSPSVGRFTLEDKVALEQLVSLLVDRLP